MDYGSPPVNVKLPGPTSPDANWLAAEPVWVQLNAEVNGHPGFHPLTIKFAYVFGIIHAQFESADVLLRSALPPHVSLFPAYGLCASGVELLGRCLNGNDDVRNTQRDLRTGFNWLAAKTIDDTSEDRVVLETRAQQYTVGTLVQLRNFASHGQATVVEGTPPPSFDPELLSKMPGDARWSGELLVIAERQRRGLRSSGAGRRTRDQELPDPPDVGALPGRRERRVDHHGLQPVRLVGTLRQPMVSTNVVNWDVEIAALQDLSVTVRQNHLLALEALWEPINGATDALAQKILTARLAAEAVTALEHVGALGWSISNRHDQGILRRYLSYATSDVREFYRGVQAGPLREVFRLPEAAVIASSAGDADAGEFERGLVALETTLRGAAGNYFALGGEVVRTYNKIKHGFPVIVRMDKLIPGKVPPTDWEQNVNVITEVTADGSLRFTDLERSVEMLAKLRNGIEACANAWRECALLVIFLWERGLPLTDPSTLAEEEDFSE